MRPALDSSVIVGAIDRNDPAHVACRHLLLSGEFCIHAHALSETFSTLTGGRLKVRTSSAHTASVLRDWVVPRLVVTTLDAADLLRAYEESSARGVRGGAIHDYLHLVAARKAGAPMLYTLNIGDFQTFYRIGDPKIVKP
ncbi:MAG: PIN domain-containing protein [Chthoniobacteraceae bacterium]